jgi:membrane-associated phospholipid phosphatase
MEQILWDLIPWGYQVLLSVEGMRNAFLDVVFPVVTDFGSELGYIVILSLVYWCVNKSVGQGVAFAYLYTSVLNSWIKLYFNIPRPDDLKLDKILDDAKISERLNPIREGTGPSFLSGHTQGAVVVWGYLAYHFKQTWFRVLALVIIVLIGFSRMYVGAHFPQDVIGGFIIGIIYLILWILLEPSVKNWLSKQTALVRYALAVLVPLIVWLIVPHESTAVPMGAAIGLGVGYTLEGQTVHFSVSGTVWRRLLRGAFGLFIVMVAYFALGYVFGTFDGSMGESMVNFWRLVRYAIIGFGGGWFIPWLFVKTKLAERESNK